MTRRMKMWLEGITPEARERVLVALHHLLLLRMRCEALWARLSLRRRPRVIATACWHFPIYSQTFVYREITQMRARRFDVRFLYSEITSKDQVAEDLASIWGLRRMLILSGPTASRDLEYYQRKSSDRVEAVAQLISRASGMSIDEVYRNEHFRHAFSFARMAECWMADYIHTYFFYERTLFALIASYVLDIPRGVSCYADHMMQDYSLKLIPLQMQSCDVVVATSERIKQELETLAGRSLPQVVVKPNAIDVQQFPPRERVYAPNGVCRITTVSRIHPKKGLLYLVDAAASLRDQGYSLIVRILGDSDPGDPESATYAAMLQEKITSLHLEEVVHLEGRKSGREVREYLTDTDLFVASFIELPNGDKDGIPTALLEAMAAGCPIVSTDAGSILEVIRHEQEGLVVPQRDSLALTSAIERMMCDRVLRDRTSEAAMKRVHAEFDIRRCEARFHERIDGVIGRSGPHAAQRVATI
jgi:colanic acid/amylovoran biosynthesis glycosyltransferase